MITSRANYIVNIVLMVIFVLTALDYLRTKNTAPWWIAALAFTVLAMTCLIDILAYRRIKRLLDEMDDEEGGIR